jgi:hypothetical protein
MRGFWVYSLRRQGKIFFFYSEDLSGCKWLGCALWHLLQAANFLACPLEKARGDRRQLEALLPTASILAVSVSGAPEG